MNSTGTALERLGYALIGISPLLPLDDIAAISWQIEPGLLRIFLTLVSGATANANVGLEDSGSSLANVVMTAFDLVQQDLAETQAYWGQALPPCRPGHSHPATCDEVGNSVALLCPADGKVVRILVSFTEA